MVTYLGQRNVAIFLADMNWLDFKIHKPDQVIASVMGQAQKKRQGHRADARFPEVRPRRPRPNCCRQLKAGGSKVVFLKAKSRAADDRVL